MVKFSLRVWTGPHFPSGYCKPGKPDFTASQAAINGVPPNLPSMSARGVGGGLKVSAYQCTSPVDEALRRCMMGASAMFGRSDFGMTGSKPLAQS
jgi:hypothetical protein